MVTSESVRTMDNTTYTYEPSSCWTLASAHCGPKPVYAVFTKKVGGSGTAMKAYLGGHSVEMTPKGSGDVDIKLNGNPITVTEGESHTHTVDGTNIME